MTAARHPTYSNVYMVTDDDGITWSVLESQPHAWARYPGPTTPITASDSQQADTVLKWFAKRTKRLRMAR